LFINLYSLPTKAVFNLNHRAHVGLKLVLSLIILIINSSFVAGQEKLVIEKNYTIEDGLPSNLVYAVEQDNLGFVWFGTDHGLSRFDGNEFVNYSITSGAPDSDILHFYKDSKEQIWCYTMNGKLAILRDGRIHSETIDGLELPDLGDQIYDIIEYNGDIFISTKYATHILKREGLVNSINTELGFHFTIIQGELYALSNNSILSFNKLEQEFNMDTTFFLKGAQAYIKHVGDSIYTYRFVGKSYSKSKLLMLLKNGTSYSFKCPFQIYNLSDISKNILLLTSTGIYEFISSDQTLRTYWDNIPATFLIKDREGYEWVSTYGSGVFIRKRSEKVFLEKRKPEGYSMVFPFGDHYYLINKRRDSIWLKNPGKADEFIYEMIIVRDLLELSSGKLLVATDVLNSTFNRHVVKSFYLDDSLLYSGSGDKVFINSIDGNNIESVKTIEGHAFGDVKKILKVNDSLLVFKNRRGIYRFNFRDSVFEDVFTRVIPTDAFYDNTDLWVGTNGMGLFKISGSDTLVYSVKDGLSSDFVKKVIKKWNRLWVLTSEGIDILDLRLDGSFDINQVTGFGRGVNDIALFKDKVLVAADDGLYSFLAKDNFNNEAQYRFVIESISSGEKQYDVNKPVQIEPESREFSLDFACVYYAPELPITYRYRLVRHGDENTPWVLSDKSQFHMANLQSDQYQLEIEFSNKNISWTRGATLDMEVLPFWWETFWFRSLAIIAFSILVTYLSFRVNAFVKSRKRYRSERLHAELRAKTAQMKPHFMFNALNSVRNFVLVNDIEQSDRYLTAYSRLMRSVLMVSDQLLIPVRKELEIIELYLSLEQMRLSNSFDYEIKMDESVDSAYCLCPAMITQPFVENAVWHGLRELTSGKLVIKVSASDGIMQFEIIDNGVGFDLSNQTSDDSFGTRILNEKLELMRKTYGFNITASITSSIGEGTHVQIKVPIGIDN